MKCRYKLAFMGRCDRNSRLYRYCWKHRQAKCEYCGEQAIGECEYSHTFICNKPTCNPEMRCRDHKDLP